MSSDEAFAQCGTWLPTQTHDHLYNTTAPLNSTNTMDGSSDLSMDPPVSLGDEHTNSDRVGSPTPSTSTNASTTAVSGDTPSTQSSETPVSYAGTDFFMDHGSVSSNESGGIPLSTQANAGTSDHEGPTTLTSLGAPLTAANLMTHEMTTSAPPPSDSSVALWLASGMDEHQVGAADWSGLVASDPVAAAIEAAVATDSQD